MFSSEWIEDCKRWYGQTLTGRHGHWCAEWDLLPIDETCGEFHLGVPSPMNQICKACGYTAKETTND